MQIDVQRIITRCQVCDKVHTLFNAPTSVLQPLHITGFGYWWSLDFARPLPITKIYNKVVMGSSPAKFKLL